jgi:hypothetical protein
VVQQAARKRLATSIKNDVKDDPDKLVEASFKQVIDGVVSATVGWSNIEDGENPIPFSEGNARDIYTRFIWIREQLETFIADRANFLKASSEN